MRQNPNESATHDSLICFRCDAHLKMAPTRFSYLKHDVTVDLPRCPVCGQVYLDESLVTGKMHDVETSLEEK